jgi:hypothetical protein
MDHVEIAAAKPSGARRNGKHKVCGVGEQRVADRWSDRFAYSRLAVSRLPPGPSNALLTTVRYLRDPFGSLLDAARKHGDPFTWPTFLGRMVVTGDPAGVKTLLSADPDIYEALGADLLAPVLGENNLILLSGERHRAMRKLQNPHFMGSACMPTAGSSPASPRSMPGGGRRTRPSRSRKPCRRSRST